MVRQRLIYIAGAGHSGSTLLEMFASGADGHVGLGEIFQLVDQRNLIIDELDGHDCSCRLPVAQCPYWAPIISDLRNIPRSDESARYAALASGFQQQLGTGRVMLDSSKTPGGLEAAAKSGAFDIKVLHLVRDVRSWIVSMQKSYGRNGVATWESNRARHGALKGTAKYLLRTPMADARQWMRLNLQVEDVIACHNLPALPVSYERLCFDTAGVQAEIEGFIDAAIAPYGDHSARANNHSIFGNRMRFEPEKLEEIRYDGAWLSDNRWLAAYMVMPGVRRLNSRLG